jgi:hypothetical protein
MQCLDILYADVETSLEDEAVAVLEPVPLRIIKDESTAMY